MTRALKALKKQMLLFAGWEELECRVRFLVIDTDDTELSGQEILKQEETLILNERLDTAVGTGNRWEIRRAYITLVRNYNKLNKGLRDKIRDMSGEVSEPVTWIRFNYMLFHYLTYHLEPGERGD